MTKQERAKRGISYRKVLEALNSADLQTGVPVQLGRQEEGVVYAAPVTEKMHDGLGEEMQREDLGS